VTYSSSILDLAAIERSLIDVQSRFEALNARFEEPRDPLVDAVRENMLNGYALVDRYVTDGVDLFDLQQVNRMLDINTTVLCGNVPARRDEVAEHIRATERRFFDTTEGNIRELLEWYEGHRDQSPWKVAAGTFVRILSTPQLFIEGNTRSASLIASYLLMRAGLPPFVLTVANAEAYFNPSAVIRKMPRHSVSSLFRLPKIKKKYAEFLKAQADTRFLLAHPTGARPARRGEAGS
jgi:hypothetical protein